MSKINKLGKSTFVIAILSFLLVAVLAFGGTYAYFSAATDAAITDSVTMGTITINELTGVAQNSIFVDGTVQPNQYILGTADAAKELTVDLTGTTINAYVRVGVKITVLDASGNDELFKNDGDKQDGLTEDQVVVFDTEVTGWEYVNGYFYLVESGKAKAVSATPAALPLQAYINKLVGKDSSRALMGAQISIEITAAALQADYLGATETSTFTATQLDAAWAHIVGNTGDYAA